MSEVIPVFVTPIYKSSVEIKNIHVQQVKGIEYDRTFKDDGDISKDTKILDNEFFADIKSEIMKHIDVFVRDYLHVDDSITFELQNSWIVRHDRGDHAPKHIHVNSVLSGILYLDVNDNHGQLNFMKHSRDDIPFPPSIQLPINEWNIFNSPSWHFSPQIGELYIFPSGLAHGVSPSNTDDRRYSLAFNVYPRGLSKLDEISSLML